MLVTEIDVADRLDARPTRGRIFEQSPSQMRRAADDVRAEEQWQLTEYVLRRKMVLDVLDGLIRRVREMASGKDDYHLEGTLHQFICPMKIRGDDPSRVESSDHDL